MDQENEKCQEAFINCKYCSKLMKRSSSSVHLNENIQTHMDQLHKELQEAKILLAQETKQRIKNVFMDLAKKCKAGKMFSAEESSASIMNKVLAHLQRIGPSCRYNCFVSKSKQVGFFFHYVNSNIVNVAHKGITYVAWETNYRDPSCQRDFGKDCESVISDIHGELSCVERAEQVSNELVKLGWDTQLVVCLQQLFYSNISDKLSADIAYNVQGYKKYTQSHDGFVYQVRC